MTSEQRQEQGDFVSDGIYLIRENGDLAELRAEHYEREDVLQRLLAAYPSVLPTAGAASGPRRWLLITREAPSRSSNLPLARRSTTQVVWTSSESS